MKLVELGLQPFGPFSSLRLDLSAPAGLHLVYGKNEAGKSTTLRAITGLLYGIPHDTRDAHRHRMPDLRIAGRLLRADGSTLHLVRRKGIKNTLLDKTGQPIDDSLLARALGGVNEQVFRAMFGLDHETLARGAEALLRGQGDLGQSLFDAGVGGAHVGDVLSELERAADELYRKRATTTRIQRGLKELADHKRAAREAVTDPAAYQKQTEELEAAERELAESEHDRRELRAERQRLERIRRALPKLAERTRLIAERAAIHGPLIGPELGEQRQKLAEDEKKLVWAVERLQRELVQERQKAEQITYSEQLARLEDERADELKLRLGAHQRAAEDLPKRRAELETAESQVRGLLARLGGGLSIEQADALRIDPATQARIRELARTHASIVRAASDAECQSAETRAALELARKAESELEPERDSKPLRAARAAALAEGDLEHRRSKLASELDALEKSANAALGALALPRALDELASVPVVDASTLDRFEQAVAKLTQRLERLGEQLDEIAASERRLARERIEITRAGEVPSPEALARARAHRDRGWELVRQAWLDGADVGEITRDWAAGDTLERAYERAVQAADELADRLRRDAERVARVATIDAEIAELGARKRELEEKRDATTTERATLDADWQAAWAPVGIAARTPREMRSWLEQFGRLLTACGTIDERRRELGEIERRCAAHAAALGTALERSEVAVAGGSSIAELSELARLTIESREAARGERERVLRERSELERTAAMLEARARATAKELAGWKQEWQLAVGPLGGDSAPSPEQVTSTLDLRDELFRALDAAAALRRRIAGIERDAAAFFADVAALCREHAPELEREPPARAAALLVRKHAEVRQLATTRAEALARADAKQRELAAVELQLELATRELGSLLRQAGVESLEELEQAERRSQDVRRIEQRLSELEHALADDTAGKSLEELERETQGIDLDRAKVRLMEIDDAVVTCDERVNEANARVQAARHGLHRFDHSNAVQAEEEAQALAAQIREDVERYLRLRLAGGVLRREIERYRDRHQGPVVERASALFRRLTRGSFSGLRADLDDLGEPILSSLRADGSPVAIAGLSEGTREQLYLALRLASIEHWGQNNELLPLILDDVLIHSDEERTLAALELFGELGERMQILLFSHHAHLVELAKQVVPAERLAVHELDAAIEAAQL